MMQVLANAQPPTATITTDASGTWGCGAFWVEAGQWIQCPWRNEWQHTPIHAKKLLLIILAIATWGPYWRSSPIKVLCDNMAVVNIITILAETNLLCTCFAASILYQRFITYK